MLAKLYKEQLPVLTAVKCQPCISVIMPFDPKMVHKTEIEHSLKLAINRVSSELSKHYDNEIAGEVFKKLMNAIAQLDYTTHKKSVAIYVSPVAEKIYYLDIPVVEKVVVDTSFEIRHIVRSKKDEHTFLVLVISAKNEKIYVGDCEKLKPVLHNRIENMLRNLPEPAANFTEPGTIKETNGIKFLHCIDNGLTSILDAYPLPLFIMATEKTLEYFKTLTKHGTNITGFIPGNFNDATESDLQKTLEPFIQNWGSVKETDLLNKLATAQNESRLAAGIYAVWTQANRKHGQLLIVEKDFNCPALKYANGETVFCNNDKKNGALITGELVDNIIEKVLENGGDVEFVDELKEYGHIALIEYYHEN
jgi:hypothetical protein